MYFLLLLILLNLNWVALVVGFRVEIIIQFIIMSIFIVPPHIFFADIYFFFNFTLWWISPDQFRYSGNDVMEPYQIDHL